jgi:hypothetical protein
MGPRHLRWVFLAILAVWMSIPFLGWGTAQDAVPFGVAGRLVTSRPSAVYVSSDADGADDVRPAFRAESCRHYRSPDACARYVTAFVSTPLALPLVVPLGWLGTHVGFALRLAGSAAFAAAMALAWRTLGARGAPTGLPLVLTAALLTPMVALTVGIGQNAPLLFLTAMLPIVAVDRPGRRAVAAALVVVTAALKVWPALLVGVVAVQRRWRLLGWIVGLAAGLCVATLLLAPPSVFPSFVGANLATTHGTARLWNNGSLDAALFRLGVPFGAVTPLAWLLRAAAAIPLLKVHAAARDDSARWGFAWLASLLFFPQVWPHYLFVGVAAAVAAVAAHPEPGRAQWVVPATAAAVAVAGWSWTSGAPLVQFGALVAMVGAVAAVLVSGSRPARRAAGGRELEAAMGPRTT